MGEYAAKPKYFARSGSLVGWLTCSLASQIVGCLVEWLLDETPSESGTPLIARFSPLAAAAAAAQERLQLGAKVDNVAESGERIN